jgi:hypothetical protein
MAKLPGSTMRTIRLYAVAVALAFALGCAARVIADNSGQLQEPAADESMSGLPDLSDLEWAIREGERWLRH